MLLAILLLSLLGNSGNATQATAKLLNGTIQVDSGNGLWTQGYPMVGVNSDTDYVPIAVDAFGNIIVSGGGGGGGGGSGDGAILDGINAALKATVTASHALKVDPSAVTQPISAASLPLPSGASQEHVAANSPNACRLSDGASFIATLPVSGAFFQTTQPVSIASMPSTPVTGPLTDTQLRATAVPISAAALPLPSGAATSANQTTANTSLASIDTDLNAFKAANHTDITSAQPRKLQDGSGNAITSVATPLGSHQALDVNTAGMSFVGTYGPISPTVVNTPGDIAFPFFAVDCSGYQALYFQIAQTATRGPGAGQTSINATGRIDSSQPWSGTPGICTPGFTCSSPTYITFGGAALDRGVMFVPCTSRYMQVGIDTYDNNTGDSSYTAYVWGTNAPGFQNVIVANPPGQSTMVNSQPVVIASDQSAIPVIGTFFQPTQPVSLATLPALSAGTAVIGHVINDASSAVIGHVINDASSAVIGHVVVDSAPATAVTGPLTDAQLRASAVPVSVASPLPVVMGALPSGSAVIGHVVVDTAPTTAVTIASLPSLAAGSAVIGHVINDASSAVIGHVIVDTAPSTAVTGPLTDTQLRASAVPTSLAVLPSLVAGSAKVGQVAIDQTTPGTTNLVSIGSNGTVGLVAGSAVIGHVIVDTAPSTAVTGPLTDTQLRASAVPTSLSTLPALTAGSAVIGHVIVDTAPTTSVTEGGTFTVQPGNTANTTPWLASINDGTNTAKVEAASTAAAAADKALVVSQNPSGGNPCLNPTATLVSITGATTTTNATQIIALSGTTKIYICSMTIIGVSGTSPTFSLVQGTGSNCVTSQTNVVQAWATTAGTLYAFANPVAVGVAGNELCYKDGGTSPVQNYQINYVQQ